MGVELSEDQTVATKLYNMFMNAEEAGYDTKDLMQKISTLTSLNAERNCLEIANDNFAKEIQRNTDFGAKQRAQIKVNSAILKEAEDLKTMSLDAAVLRDIKSVLTSVANANGFTDKQVTEKFANDILTMYEPLVGLEKEIHTKQKEKKDIEEQIESLKLEYAKDRRAFEALRVLLEKSIKSSEILALKNMVEQESHSSLTTASITELWDKIARFESLVHASIEFEKQVGELQTRKDALQASVSLLESKVAVLNEYLTNAVIEGNNK